jgi:hypothetical protein
MRRFLGITCLLWVLLTPARAQVIRPSCTIDELEGFFAALDATVVNMRLARTMGNLDEVLALVNDLDVAIQGVKTACNPLRFTSDDEGLQAVIGPVSIAPGSYLATVVTDGPITVDLVASEGECSPQAEGMLFDVAEAEAATGIEALVSSRGCIAVITTHNADQPWTLSLVRIR